MIRQVESSPDSRAARTVTHLFFCLVIGMFSVLGFSKSYAWAPQTHLYMAGVVMDDVLDNGKVTIYRVDHESGRVLGVLGEYEVDRQFFDNVISDRNTRLFYYFGSCGYDLLPDRLLSQFVIQDMDPGALFGFLGAESEVGNTDRRSYELARNRAFYHGFSHWAVSQAFFHDMAADVLGENIDRFPNHVTAETIVDYNRLQGYVGHRSPDRWDLTRELIGHFKNNVDGPSIFSDLVVHTYCPYLLWRGQDWVISDPRQVYLNAFDRFREAFWGTSIWPAPYYSNYLGRVMELDQSFADPDKFDKGEAAIIEWLKLRTGAQLVYLDCDVDNSDVLGAFELPWDYFEREAKYLSNWFCPFLTHQLPEDIDISCNWFVRGYVAGFFEELRILDEYWVLDIIDVFEDLYQFWQMYSGVGVVRKMVEFAEWVFGEKLQAIATDHYEHIVRAYCADGEFEAFLKNHPGFDNFYLGGFSGDGHFDTDDNRGLFNSLTMQKLMLLSPRGWARLLEDVGSNLPGPAHVPMRPDFVTSLRTPFAADNTSFFLAQDCAAYRKLFMRGYSEPDLPCVTHYESLARLTVQPTRQTATWANGRPDRNNSHNWFGIVPRRQPEYGSWSEQMYYRELYEKTEFSSICVLDGRLGKNSLVARRVAGVVEEQFGPSANSLNGGLVLYYDAIRPVPEQFNNPVRRPKISVPAQKMNVTFYQFYNLELAPGQTVEIRFSDAEPFASLSNGLTATLSATVVGAMPPKTERISYGRDSEREKTLELKYSDIGLSLKLESSTSTSSSSGGNTPSVSMGEMENIQAELRARLPAQMAEGMGEALKNLNTVMEKYQKDGISIQPAGMAPITVQFEFTLEESLVNSEFIYMRTFNPQWEIIFR